MNKKIIKLFTTITLAAAIAACGSGGSSSSSSPTLSIGLVTGPSGAAPAQNLGAGMGTGSVYVNTSTGNPLYLLGNATGTVNAVLTADVGMTSGTTIIGSWLTSSNILFGPAPSANTVATYFSANLALPLSTTNTNTAAYWESATLTNANRTICFGSPQAGSSGCAGSNAPTGARLVTSNSGQTQFMFVGYGQPGVVGAESIGYNALSNNSGVGTPVTSEAYVSLASCVASGSGSVSGQGATTVSSIAASNYQTNPLFIAGTNSGDVCVGVIPSSAEATAFQSSTIVNLTALVKAAGASYTFQASPVTVNSTQATGGYNTLGAVNAIAATPQGANNASTIIAWTQGTSGVYAATLATSATSGFGFANLVDTTKYNNSPYNQAVSVIYVDFYNNIYVGTFSNMVYVLPSGSNTWLNVAIPNPGTSQIYNFSAGFNGNVYAYTANGTTSAVYSITLQ